MIWLKRSWSFIFIWANLIHKVNKEDFESNAENIEIQIPKFDFARFIARIFNFLENYHENSYSKFIKIKNIKKIQFFIWRYPAWVMSFSEIASKSSKMFYTEEGINFVE